MLLLNTLLLCIAVYAVGRAGFRLLYAAIDLVIDYFLPPPPPDSGSES